MLAAIYHKGSWPTLAAPRSSSRSHGDGSLLLPDLRPVPGPQAERLLLEPAGRLRFNTCLDFRPRPTSGLHGMGEGLGPSRPTSPSMVAYNDLSCAYWAVQADRTAAGFWRPARRRSSWSARPATRPRRTPGPWRSPRSSIWAVLITRKGEGHSGYEIELLCVQRAVDAYLLDLTGAEGRADLRLAPRPRPSRVAAAGRCLNPGGAALHHRPR